ARLQSSAVSRVARDGRFGYPAPPPLLTPELSRHVGSSRHDVAITHPRRATLQFSPAPTKFWPDGSPDRPGKPVARRRASSAVFDTGQTGEAVWVSEAVPTRRRPRHDPNARAPTARGSEKPIC